MTALYRGMDRATLDIAYNNVKAAADFPGTMARFRAQSEAFYRRVPGRRDIAYGEGSRQRFDWLPCGASDAPTFIFIHGGYWQNCVKEDFAFVASGPFGHGFNVVLAEYTLAPAATMTQIVAEIGMLLDHLAAARDETGFAGRPVCLAGHSAGGQLAALYRAHPAVTYALPISALVDLEPIALSWLNDALQLTSTEIDAYSPLRHIGRGVPMTVSVGGDELPELVRHSRDYAAACATRGEQATWLPVQGCTHFSVLDDLSEPDGMQMSALVDAMHGRRMSTDSRVDRDD
ncbi:alpha/beta hydrolase [Paraburkholderia flava]|uniref:alpha/beta hydrolase n=1 Tax=Paraburkholderia flava TaxID=2547393 RepID=UPI0010623952|nr:alpha/beta hydrolase [Paraburkholderia flava]